MSSTTTTTTTPTPSSSSSYTKGEFFSSPEIDQRNQDDPECLRPSKLRDDYSSAESINHTSTFVKCQQTSSRYLNPTIRNLVNNYAETEFITSSISNAINAILVDNNNTTESLISNISFEPKGCIWTMDLEAHADYQIQIVCSAREQGQITTTFVVETNLLNKATGDVIMDTVQPDDEGGKALLQSAFDEIAHVVGKAVVKCEFPNFPEGCQEKPFKEIYKLSAKLKMGTHSTICRGVHRDSGVVVCVKCVRRTDLPAVTDAAIYDEVALLSSISHPHVVPLIDFFEEVDCYYLVKELQSGGEVLERIGNKGSLYGEGDARDILQNLLSAITVCHEHQIAHRDINPKNVLVVNEEEHNTTNVKFTGFSFAARCHAPKSLKRQLGTPVFVAPEVLRNQPYDTASDMWSVGVLAYLLLSGRLPFVGQNQRELFRNIVMGKYEFDNDHWEDVSPDGRAFVSRLLVVDPAKRMTAESASKHLWMQLQYSFLQKRSLEDASERIKIFYEKQQIHRQESQRSLQSGSQH